MRVGYKTTRDRQRGVANKKRGVKHHEVFQLEIRPQADQRRDGDEHEARDRRLEDPLGDHPEQDIFVFGEVQPEEPFQGDVAAVDRCEGANSQESEIGCGQQSGARFVHPVDVGNDDVMRVSEPVESGRANRRKAAFSHHPRCKAAVHDEQQKEDDSAKNVTRANRGFFTVHLDRPLPVLKIKPRPNQQADKKWHDKTQEVRALPLTGAFKAEIDPRPLLRVQTHNHADHAEENDEPKNRMRELDALDTEFLAEETAGREDHKHDHAEVKGIEAAGEKLDRPKEVLRQREDR